MDLSPNKKSLRQYLVEYALIALAAAVVYLFLLYQSINEKIVVREQQLILDSQKVIDNNSRALDANTEALYWFNDNNHKTYPK